jgi:threonine dehydrogenase-like Zn-dependent dehydrogenase
MSQFSRRQFLTGVAATGAAAFLTPRSRILGANDDIRVAVVGCGGRGGGHIKGFRGQKGARLVALCDPDENRIMGHV